MTNCTDCRYQENMCKWPCDDCVKGDKWEEKPFTNADRLNAMTVEEKAKLIGDGCPPNSDDVDCNVYLSDDFIECKWCWLDWLKQEVQE